MYFFAPENFVIFKVNNNSHIWVGATDSASEGNTVWCEPNGDNEPIHSQLSSVVKGISKQTNIISNNNDHNDAVFSCLVHAILKAYGSIHSSNNQILKVSRLSVKKDTESRFPIWISKPFVNHVFCSPFPIGAQTMTQARTACDITHGMSHLRWSSVQQIYSSFAK